MNRRFEPNAESTFSRSTLPTLPLEHPSCSRLKTFRGVLTILAKDVRDTAQGGSIQDWIHLIVLAVAITFFPLLMHIEGEIYEPFQCLKLLNGLFEKSK